MLAALKKYLIRKVFKSSYPPGHYYSPIPSLSEVHRDSKLIFSENGKPDGIDLNVEGQKRLLGELKILINNTTLSPRPGEFRFYSNNGFFVDSDALYYQAVVKNYKPRRVIEIGCGFSSAALFDALENSGLEQTSVEFIEPYPDRLLSLLKKGDEKRYRLHSKRLQEVDVELFSALGENDILFIDSSHISKAGSDVNLLIFNVLPNLKSGVFVHFHDILYPFEYPKEWIMEGRFWNEAYLLRSFLMYNRDFSIILFNDHLVKTQREFIFSIDPRLSAAGGSLWLQKK